MAQNLGVPSFERWRLCASWKSCNFPYKVTAESTLRRKGVLVEHHIKLVPKIKASKSLRITTQIEAYGSLMNQTLFCRETHWKD